jgi:hypothetical protein
MMDDDCLELCMVKEISELLGAGRKDTHCVCLYKSVICGLILGRCANGFLGGSLLGVQLGLLYQAMIDA